MAETVKAIQITKRGSARRSGKSAFQRDPVKTRGCDEGRIMSKALPQRA
jgi:hypothetical protein